METDISANSKIRSKEVFNSRKAKIKRGKQSIDKRVLTARKTVQDAFNNYKQFSFWGNLFEGWRRVIGTADISWRKSYWTAKA